MAACVPPTKQALLRNGPAPDWKLSRAFVTVEPQSRAGLVLTISQMAGVEVQAADAAHIAVAIEGVSSATIWQKLREIARLEGVAAATLDLEECEELLAS